MNSSTCVGEDADENLLPFALQATDGLWDNTSAYLGLFLIAVLLAALFVGRRLKWELSLPRLYMWAWAAARGSGKQVPAALELRRLFFLVLGFLLILAPFGVL